MHAVKLDQVGGALARRQVVERDKLERVGVGVKGDAQREAADAAEAVERDLDRRHIGLVVLCVLGL